MGVKYDLQGILISYLNLNPESPRPFLNLIPQKVHPTYFIEIK